jgi:hypothetical protein
LLLPLWLQAVPVGSVAGATDNPVVGVGEGDGDSVGVDVGVTRPASTGNWVCLGVGVGDGLGDSPLVGVGVDCVL